MASSSKQVLFLNRYELTEHLAEGGSANVFRVIDTWAPNRRLVAKVQRDDDPRLGRALQREYATLLLHPPMNAPQPVLLHRLEKPLLMGAYRLEGLVLIETQVPGLEWHQWLAQAPTKQEILQAIATLLKSLHGLHQSGLRHGDIKPENILIPQDQPTAAAWIDFGLSDRPGILHGGTPKYLAPEALNGQPELASDLFALGKILEDTDGPAELKTLLAGLRAWNPAERMTATQALEQVHNLLGEADSPTHQNPINPWALDVTSFESIAGALKTRRAVALHACGGRDEGADLWCKAASAQAIKEGWDLISFDALEAMLLEAEEAPHVEDAAHFVIERLLEKAHSNPLVVDAGERLPDSFAELLSLRFSRSTADKHGILWLCWGNDETLADWKDTIVDIPRWDIAAIQSLVTLYRPDLVQPQKVASRLYALTDGGVGAATQLMWNDQSAPEPDLWNLRQSARNAAASLSKVGLGLSRQPLSLASLSDLLERYQSGEETQRDLASLILNTEVESTDGGASFGLTSAAFRKLDLERSLEPARLTCLLETIEAPLATLLLPTSHPWKAHISLVDLLESAKYHYAKREWTFAAECFQAAREVNAEFNDTEITLYINALTRSGQAGAAIGLLETLDNDVFRLSRASMMLEHGFVHEAHDALESLSKSSRSQAATLQLSRAKLKLGKFTEAKELAESIGTPSNSRDKVEQACLQGIVATFRGEAQLGADYLEPLLESYPDDPELTGKLSSALALVYQKSGRSEKAKALYLQSIACAEETYSTKAMLNRLTNLGTLEQNVYDYGAALDTYKKASKLAQALNDTSALLRSGLNLANLQSILGQTHEARTTLSNLEFLSRDQQFKTEGSYIKLLRLDLELLEASLPADFHKQLRNLESALEQEGLHAALEEATLLRLKAESVTEPNQTTIVALLDWSKRQLETGRESLALQGLFALVRCLSQLGDISSEESALRFLRDQTEKGVNPELNWAVSVLHAVKETQVRNFEEADKLWRHAREAHQVLNRKIPPGLQQQFFGLMPRNILLRHQQENISMHARPESNNLPSVSRLFQIMRALAQETDTERLLSRILDSVVMLSGAERGLLVLASKDDDSLTVRATSGVYEHEAETKAFSRTIAQRAIEALQPIRSGNLQTDGRFNSDHSVHVLSLQSTLCLPLHAPPRVKGALYLDHRMKANAFEDADISVLWAFADQAAIGLANAYVIDELSSQKSKLEVAQRELTMVQKELQSDLAKTQNLSRHTLVNDVELTGPMAEVGVITQSHAMLLISQMVTKVAPTSLPVTISGESGTGKELIARAIHQGSVHGNNGKFVALNCGAVADGLWESELFGHERGAFTGANREKPGLFEVARDGTLFLDEIGDLPLEVQVKLLRVIQQGEFRRVGGHRVLKTNARVVCATHRSLESMVQSGTFREDLWYRLNVIELHLPPLRERPEDIAILIDHFLQHYGPESSKAMSSAAMTLLQNHSWPGNIRELENELQRALALSEDVIEPEHLSPKLQEQNVRAHVQVERFQSERLGPLKPQVESFERHYIEKMLKACGGNRTQAAKALGLTRPGFYKKLKTLGIHKS